MLNLARKGKSIAIIEGGKNKGKVIYLDPQNYNIHEETDSESSYSDFEESSSEEVKPKKLRGIEISDNCIKLRDGIFSPYPDNSKNRQRQVLYIAGPSGSGKSTYTGKFLKHYSKINPKNNIIIFSRVPKDDAFLKKKLKIKRVKLDESLVENPIEIEKDLKNSVVIFDDINTIRDKKIREEVGNVQGDILEVGRHASIDVICTNHKLMDYVRTRTLLNEAHLVTFFTGVAGHHNKRFLKEYCGLSKQQIDKIMSSRSRWVTICKQYPMYCLTETQIFLLN